MRKRFPPCKRPQKRTQPIPLPRSPGNTKAFSPQGSAQPAPARELLLSPDVRADQPQRDLGEEISHSSCCPATYTLNRVSMWTQRVCRLSRRSCVLRLSSLQFSTRAQIQEF